MRNNQRAACFANERASGRQRTAIRAAEIRVGRGRQLSQPLGQVSHSWPPLGRQFAIWRSSAKKVRLRPQSLLPPTPPLLLLLLAAATCGLMALVRRRRRRRRELAHTFAPPPNSSFACCTRTPGGVAGRLELKKQTTTLNGKHRRKQLGRCSLGQTELTEQIRRLSVCLSVCLPACLAGSLGLNHHQQRDVDDENWRRRSRVVVSSLLCFAATTTTTTSCVSDSCERCK